MSLDLRIEIVRPFFLTRLQAKVLIYYGGISSVVLIPNSNLNLPYFGRELSSIIDEHNQEDDWITDGDDPGKNRSYRAK